MPALTTSPWDKAVSRFSDKTVVGSKLRTADWQRVPLALRERAFFSAGVENARTLSSMREKILQGMQQERPGGIGMNKARFVADMRLMLGAEPGDSGSLTDVTSVKRLSLIWDFQNADAHGFAARKADLDPNLLDAFPAYRLVRVESRRVPRAWFALWAIAGAKVGWVGASMLEMVALKTSRIWVELSRFGRPWPPFDYNSGMGLDDVDRDEAERLKLLRPREPVAERLQRLRDGVAQAQQEWNDGLQASVKGLSPTARDWLQNAFGGQISIEGDAAVWQGEVASQIAPAAAPASMAPAVVPASTRQAPVSAALTNSTRGELGSHIDTATKAVDSVHDDGDLPAIPIRRLESSRALGQYQWGPGGKSVDISIKHAPEAWPALTTAHEIGHFLDHQVIGTRGTFASMTDPILADFREVVGRSDAVRRMREIMPEGAEFLKPYELWARAYAQYIATQSGDRQLLAQLDHVRAGGQSWRQWTDEDFKPIAAAIDELMRKKGWRK